MILGVDHVALSCAQIETAAQQLESLGFTSRFIQRGLLNHPLKRPFLRAYAPEHAIAFCQAPTGVAIELTEHGELGGGAPSPYQVLLASGGAAFTRGTTDGAVAEVWRASLGCGTPERMGWPALQTELWVDQASDPAAPAGIRALGVPVAEMEPALRLWRDGLQFREGTAGAASGQRWCELVFRTPVAHWSARVILFEGSSEQSPPMLDQPGFPCLALLSTNLERDSERLQRQGAAETTGAFALEVDGKPLKVALLRGGNGEILELIDASGRR
jgi:hypothetical protein